MKGKFTILYILVKNNAGIQRYRYTYHDKRGVGYSIQKHTNGRKNKRFIGKPRKIIHG